MRCRSVYPFWKVTWRLIITRVTSSSVTFVEECCYTTLFPQPNPGGWHIILGWWQHSQQQQHPLRNLWEWGAQLWWGVWDPPSGHHRDPPSGHHTAAWVNRKLRWGNTKFFLVCLGFLNLCSVVQCFSWFLFCFIVDYPCTSGNVYFLNDFCICFEGRLSYLPRVTIFFL